MPKRTDIQSILVIGSGPIVIGQACEFDYAGVQACKVLRREGYRVILVNSNPATIMTDPEFADATYIEPLVPELIEKIIALEKPDALLPTVGGQTALNLATELEESGILRKHGVQLIGARVDAIKIAEDRQLFKDAMLANGLRVPVGDTVDLAWSEAVALRRRWRRDALAGRCALHYPVLIRPSFTLGGSGGGVAYDEADLRAKVYKGLHESPTHQVLIEQSVAGWKEFELEVMRDYKDNFVVVCSIENIDPMGVHTGDSITVAPAQTLTDKELQRLRDMAKIVMRAVGRGNRRQQCPVRGQPAHGRGAGDRDEPARVALVRAGLQSHRLPHRQDRRAAGRRLLAGRDPQRHHQEDARLLRAVAGLRGGQGPALGFREIPRRRPHPRPADEIGRRGHGDRPHVQGGAEQGGAGAGDRASWGWRARGKRSEVRRQRTMSKSQHRALTRLRCSHRQALLRGGAGVA